MSFSTYGGLKAAVADWLDRSDMTARIPDFITLATATLNKVLRDRRMVAVVDAALSGNPRFAVAPTDMLEPLMAYWLGDGRPLQIVTPDRLVALRQTRLTAAGSPRYMAIVGARLELCPTPAASGVELSYYAEIPALVADGDTNWVLTDEPDIYLYTALLHAAQLLHDPEMAAQVRALLDVKIAAAVGTEAKVTEGAG